jgi:hypothetical protein
MEGGLLVINIEWGAWCGWSTWGFKFICVEITAIYSGMFYQVYMEILSLSEQTDKDRLRNILCVYFFSIRNWFPPEWSLSIILRQRGGQIVVCSEFE